MLGLSVIILFKSLLHVFCPLVFSAHNTYDSAPEPNHRGASASKNMTSNMIFHRFLK